VAILDRQGGRAMFNRLKLGDVRHLVVAKLDRLGRWAADILRTIEELEPPETSRSTSVDFGGDTGREAKAHLHRPVPRGVGRMGSATRSRAHPQDGRIQVTMGELTRHHPLRLDCLYRFRDG